MRRPDAYATIRPVQTRRRGRPSQVRPRPPSTGRPAPVRVRPVAPTSTRLAPHRRIERRRGLPIVIRLALVVGVVALGGLVLWTAGGGLSFVAASLGGTFGGIVDDLTATRAPTSTPTVIADAPTVVAPAEAYTRAETVDVSVMIPAAIAGSDDHRVVLYVTLPEQAPVEVADATVGRTSTVLLPDVPLAEGRNDFHATIDGPGGESEASPVVTYVLDKNRPRITLTSPKDGAVVNRESVKVTGKTQGRSTVVVRNEANGATASTTAENDGTFELSVRLRAGTNGITITATDPAGNERSETVTVRRGSGELRASLSGSAYRFRMARLPDDVEFRVVVTDPDGRPLAGATVLFTITVPGLEAIVSSQLTTGGDGSAVFRTRIAKGATEGTGLATVLVETDEFGDITDRQVLTVVE